MMSLEWAPIIFTAGIITNLLIVLIAITRHGQKANWFVPALMILAGVGLVSFLIFSFTAAPIYAAGHF
jgi:hypothetical protein